MGRKKTDSSEAEIKTSPYYHNRSKVNKIPLNRHRCGLTSGPPDGYHDQQAVFVFAVGLRDPAEHLPGSADLLHS